MKQSSSLVNVSATYPSSLTNVLVTLPVRTTTVRRVRLMVTMSGFASVGSGCVFNLLQEDGTQMVGNVISTNGIWQVLEFANDNLHNSTNYLQLSQLWQGGVSAGTVTLNSFMVEAY